MRASTFRRKCDVDIPCVCVAGWLAERVESKGMELLITNDGAARRLSGASRIVTTTSSSSLLLLLLPLAPIVDSNRIRYKYVRRSAECESESHIMIVTQSIKTH